ncbi:MAG: hybrid sensor histidine kinase/response regulator, partial [Planctomycetia bacterium]
APAPAAPDGALDLDRALQYVRRLEQGLDELRGRLAVDCHNLVTVCDSVHDSIHEARLLRFAEATRGLDRAARDVARSTGKEVHLHIDGGDVMLDRSVLEGLKDPLLHLVRNAVDHGVEPPAVRRGKGKPAAGSISITARLRGSQVEVAVGDDGGGLDLDALRRRAQRDDRRYLDDRDLARSIFLPGVSTRKEVGAFSGRGVGLDVVPSRLQSMLGDVDVENAPGVGVKFLLTVPLTLTTQRVLMVRCERRTFAIPVGVVGRVFRVQKEAECTVNGRPALVVDGAPLPTAALADVLLLPTGGRDGRGRVGVVLQAGDTRGVVQVDEVLVEQEIVVKTLGDRLRRVPLVSGATILPSGRISLVLNTAQLVRSVLRGTEARSLATAGGPASAPKPTAAKSASATKRLLVVDDSTTTRALIKHALEQAGYHVTAAGDGETAWRLLSEQGADLVVSDVDMPGMDGFMLAGAIRASSEWRETPVVLVTSRSTDADKARGVAVGADAYIVKKGFDQQTLLDAVRRLL